MKHTNSQSVKTAENAVVTLDSVTVTLPVGRKSLAAIRSHLETLALGQQRILGEMFVDGISVDFTALPDKSTFRRVDAQTVPLRDLPLVLLTTATHQVSRARKSVEDTMTLVLINDPATARELWWKVADQLKEAILTLSLMPENLCQSHYGMTFHKLRRWQLEQVAVLVRQVDQACDTQNNFALSDTLEKQILPWLDRLAEHIRLWLQATQAGSRLGIKPETA